MTKPKLDKETKEQREGRKVVEKALREVFGKLMVKESDTPQPKSGQRPQSK